MGAGFGEGGVEVGKSDVVAGGQADAHVCDVDGDGGVSGFYCVGFGESEGVVEVDFVVVGVDVFPGDQQGVAYFAGGGGGSEHADGDSGVGGGGDVADVVGPGAVEGFGDVGEAVAEGAHCCFGEDDEVGVVGGGFVGPGVYEVEVCVQVSGGGDLCQRDAHCSFLCGGGLAQYGACGCHGFEEASFFGGGAGAGTAVGHAAAEHG